MKEIKATVFLVLILLLLVIIPVRSSENAGEINSQLRIVYFFKDKFDCVSINAIPTYDNISLLINSSCNETIVYETGPGSLVKFGSNTDEGSVGYVNDLRGDYNRSWDRNIYLGRGRQNKMVVYGFNFPKERFNHLNEKIKFNCSNLYNEESGNYEDCLEEKWDSVIRDISFKPTSNETKSPSRDFNPMLITPILVGLSVLALFIFSKVKGKKFKTSD